MTTRFDRAVQLVLQKEGGFQKHKNDSGNYNSRKELVGTNLGIAAPTYERYLKRPPTEQDMRNLTTAIARDIYHRLYWLPTRADQMECEGLAISIFDWFVNAGAPAVRNIQAIVGVDQDGKIGPNTIRAINNYTRANGCAETISEYTKRREEFYRNLVTRRPSLRVFLTGWLRRTRQVYDYVKSLAIKLLTMFCFLLFVGSLQAQDIDKTPISYTQYYKKGKPSATREGGFIEMRNGFVVLSAHDRTRILKVVADSTSRSVRQLFVTDKLDWDDKRDTRKHLLPLVIFNDSRGLDRGKLVLHKREWIDFVF